jgi:hypothetical protein
MKPYLRNSVYFRELLKTYIAQADETYISVANNLWPNNPNGRIYLSQLVNNNRDTTFPIDKIDKVSKFLELDSNKKTKLHRASFLSQKSIDFEITEDDFQNDILYELKYGNHKSKKELEISILNLVEKHKES